MHAIAAPTRPVADRVHGDDPSAPLPRARGDGLAALIEHFLEPVIALTGALGAAVRLSGFDERERAAEGTGGTEAPLFIIGAQTPHVLAVPLGHRGQALGVCNLFFDRPGTPAPDIGRLMRPIGELLGLALAHVRLESENLRATVVQERQMMAAEVHDAVAQDLTFLRMRLPLLEQAIAAQDGAHAATYVAELRDALGRAHASLRAIITEFRTPPDPHGFAHGLHERVQALAVRSGITASLDNAVGELALPAALESQLLHIAGEALANVERHAHAAHAWVVLRACGGGLELCVEDDGAGLASGASRAGHYGLQIMAERARRIGGELAVEARAGGGTAVRLRFAVPAEPVR